MQLLSFPIALLVTNRLSEPAGRWVWERPIHMLVAK